MGKLKDLTGQRFGRWTVLYRTNNHIQPSGKSIVVWRCKCDCGNEKDVISDVLLNGKSTSCGCYQREQTSKAKFEDLTGQRFGKLLVLYRAKDHVRKNGIKTVRWHCKCDCGNEKDILGASLKSGSSTSCQKCKGEDLTGQRFGKLVAMYQVKSHISKGGSVLRKWHCKCDCGNEKDVMVQFLKNGDIQSCGCNRAPEDLTGKKFDQITVIKPVKGDDGITKWYCKCSCGKEFLVSNSNIRHIHSCGCMNESYLERYVESFLKEKNISFTKQVKFDNLVGLGGKKLSYDFGIKKYKKYIALIECQGIQHYEPSALKPLYFAQQKEHDRLKKQYAIKNDIEFIEIEYYLEENEINDKLNTVLNKYYYINNKKV